jgi:hypothetical protein
MLHCILPVGKYGCETWSLTLREEYRQIVFENMVLRKISWTKGDEYTGDLKRLLNEELMICTPRQILFG